MCEEYKKFVGKLNRLVHGYKDKKLTVMCKEIGLEFDDNKGISYNGDKVGLKKYYNQVVKNKLESFFKNNKDNLISEIYSKGKSYTVLINNILVPYLIATIFGYDIENEYYRIDTIGYTNNHQGQVSDDMIMLGLEKHLWDLDVAVEHENKCGAWIDEAIKLIHVNCNYKIVIGYNWGKQWAKDSAMREELEKECIKIVKELVEKTKVYSNNKQGELLFIFGNPFYKREENLIYNGYILDLNDNKIQQIKGETK